MISEVTLSKVMRTVKGKTYAYWFLIWYDSDGKRRTKSLGCAGDLSKRRADKQRQAKQNELNANPRRRDADRSPELGTYIEGYLASRKGELAKGTLELHGQTGRYLVVFFGASKQLDTISRADARDFQTALSNNELARANKRRRQNSLASTTVDRHVREAKTIFEVALKDDMIPFNPFDKLKSRKPVKKEWHYVGDEEFASLLAACSPAWRLLLGLARWGGLRSEEALEVPWRKIDWEKHVICIEARNDWKPKDGEKRTIPISPILYALLREFRDRDPTGEMVIPRADVCRTNLWRDFQSLFRRARVRPYSKPMHTLRKCCLTDWADTQPSHFVQAWAGHSDYRTTANFYLQVPESGYRKAAGLPLGEEAEKTTRWEKCWTVIKSVAGEKNSLSGDPQLEFSAGDTSGHREGLRQNPPQTPDFDLSIRRKSRAGEGIRTPDVQLGKLAFYH